MKKLGVILVIFLGYWLDGHRQLSENNVRKFLLDQAINTYQGNNETVCDTFADEVEVDVVDRGPQGRWEVQGGKNEVCGYIRQASAAYMVLRARMETSVEDLVVQRAGFPWRTAEISYRQKTNISAGNGPPIPTMTAISDDHMTLKRTLGGLRITRLEAKSRTDAE